MWAHVTSDVVLETQVLILRRLEDRINSLGFGLDLEAKILGLGLGLVAIMKCTPKHTVYAIHYTPCPKRRVASGVIGRHSYRVVQCLLAIP
jgi:hypothetical protein